MITKEAIILAGGEGTRLQSTVPGIPKTLAPVNGRPFLDYILNELIQSGIQRFIFAIGKEHSQIVDHLQTQYSHLDQVLVLEEKPLGTGGAIMKALQHCKENTVAIVNGDTLFKVKLDKMASFHHMCGAECTLALKPMKSFSRYGEVKLNRDYSIASFHEKTQVSEGLINGGFYLLNKRLFLENELNGEFSFEADYLEKKIGQRRIFGVVQDGYFIDIGVPEDYFRAQDEIKKLP